MPLLTIIVVLLFVGFVLWLLNLNLLPIDPSIKRVIAGLIILVTVLWIVSLFVPSVYVGVRR